MCSGRESDMEKRKTTLSFEPPVAPRASADDSVHSEEGRQKNKAFEITSSGGRRYFKAPFYTKTGHTIHVSPASS